MTQDATTASGAAGAVLRRRRGGLPVRLVASFDDDLAGLHTVSVHTHAPYAVVWLELERAGGQDDPAADEALRTCAAAVAASCRSGDGVHRTSPTEIVLLLPGADLAAAAGLAERALSAVRAQRVPCTDLPGDSCSTCVSARAGVAAFRPGTGQTAVEVAADARRRVRVGPSSV